MVAITKNTIPGTEITLGHHIYVIPPAPFACVQKYEDVFMGREKAPSPSVMFDILFMSLQRNDPDLSRETLSMDVDLANMGAAFSAVMETNIDKNALQDHQGNTDTASGNA